MRAVEAASRGRPHGPEVTILCVRERGSERERQGELIWKVSANFASIEQNVSIRRGY